GMVSVLLQDANLLLLDEPTNHLDIPSKEILLKALQEYSGTIVFVSHDRDFVNALATHIIELKPNGAHVYHGNYDSYVEQVKAHAPVTAEPQTTTKNSELESGSDKNQSFEMSKKSKRLEEKIARLEKDIKEVEYSFADVEYGTPEFSDTEKRLSKLQAELNDTHAQWEELQKRLSAF
ncbi:MAG TPA: hypothetical protein VLG71_01515, partial [Candidatus Limnocylindria bacterium]|nr:hypothetical protein [Candidatus Limnocylindria bacterium]